jgi:multisubunit Na+/H+ antiporter MnhC subunit
MTVAGELDAFDAAAFRTLLAAQLAGVAAEHIALALSPGSVRVAATISPPSLALASQAISTLQRMTNSTHSLGAALNVTVEAVQTPTLVISVAPAHSPPPLAPQTSTPQGSNQQGSDPLVLALALGGAAVGLVMVALFLVRRTCLRKPRCKPDAERETQLEVTSQT